MKVFEDNGDPSRELFSFLRKNQTRDDVVLSPAEEGFYKEFVRKFKMLTLMLEKSETTASNVLGAITSMFGFNRHFCSISGLPILGKYFKIGSKIVSEEAYESYKIIQELEKIENKEIKDIKDVKLAKAKKIAAKAE